MTPEEVIANAGNALCSMMGAGEATNRFKTSVSKALRISQFLTEEQRKHFIRAMCGRNVIFDNTDSTGPDHSYVAAIRMVVRQLHAVALHLNGKDKEGVSTGSKLRHLVIGGSAREVAVYAQNPNVDIWLHHSEAKDVTRIDLPMAVSIFGAAGRSPNQFGSCYHGRDFGKALRSYNLAEYGTAPARIFGVLPSKVYDIGILEDAHYNIDSAGYFDIFERTGIKQIRGYGVQPLELIFPECPPSPYYTLRSRVDCLGNTTHYLTWKGCNSNGYAHGSSWDVISENPLLVSNSHNYSLAIEITNVIDMMVCFSITKSTRKDVIVRALQLPLHLHYMRVLDMKQSFRAGGASIKSTGLVYMSVSNKDFYSVSRYALSLPAASLTFAVVFSYWCKLCGGLALGTVAIERSEMPQANYCSFVAMVVLMTKLTVGDYAGTMSALEARNEPTAYHAVVEAWQDVVQFCTWPYRRIIDWLVRYNLTDKLVIAGPVEQFQTGRTSASIVDAFYKAEIGDVYIGDHTDNDVESVMSIANRRMREQEAAGAPEGDETEDVGNSDLAAVTESTGGPLASHTCHHQYPVHSQCVFCRTVVPRLGKQVMECKYKADSPHSFTLSQDEITRITTTLSAGIANGAGGLAKTLAGALEKIKALDSSGFTHTCRLEILHAGPGTGKSHAIRQLVDVQDAIVVPMQLLIADYAKIKRDDSPHPIPVPVHTMHHACYKLGVVKTLVFDEAMAMDYGILACIVNITQPDVVIFAGDSLQTSVLESEGIPMLTKIVVEDYSIHVPHVNFRNSPEVVDMLKTCGYPNMRSGVVRSLPGAKPSVRLITTDDYNPEKYKAHVKLCLSHKTFNAVSGLPPREGDDKPPSVRSYQGKTLKDAILFLDGRRSDIVMLRTLTLLRVGVSRATGELIIVVNSNTASLEACALVGVSDLYMQLFTSMGQVDASAAVVSLAAQATVDIPEVLPVTRNTADAFLNVLSLSAPEAICDEVTSLNLTSSSILATRPSSMVVNPSALVQPRGKGGVPAATGIEYMSIGPGQGMHYTSSNPLQVLNVMSGRYDRNSPQSRLSETAVPVIDAVFSNYHRIASINGEGGPANQLDEQAIHDIVSKCHSHLISKGASKKVTQEMAEMDLNKIHFAVKDVFKVKTGCEPQISPATMDLCKFGQGISAWSVASNVMFTAVVRCITATFRLNERADKFVRIVTDNKVEEKEFLGNVTELFRMTPDGSEYAVQDGVMFDAQQNEATQLLERKMWEWAGVNPAIIDLYFAFRKHYKLTTPFAMVLAHFEKTSGETFTLEGNGLISRMLGLFTIGYDGPMVLVFKGDDLCIRALNLRAMPDRIAQLEAIMPLRLRLTIGKGADFCGYAVVDGSIIPSIVRRFQKVVGHRIPNYAAFCLLRIALGDFVALVDSLQHRAGQHYVEAGNCSLYGVGLSQLEGMLDALRSLSHINEEQFNVIYKNRTEFPYVLSDIDSQGNRELVQLVGTAKRAQEDFGNGRGPSFGVLMAEAKTKFSTKSGGPVPIQTYESMVCEANVRAAIQTVVELRPTGSLADAARYNCSMTRPGAVVPPDISELDMTIMREVAAVNLTAVTSPHQWQEPARQRGSRFLTAALSGTARSPTRDYLVRTREDTRGPAGSSV